MISIWIFKIQQLLTFKKTFNSVQRTLNYFDHDIDLEDDLGSSILFQEWILEVRIIWQSDITLLSRQISSKVIFSSLSDMLIIC